MFNFKPKEERFYTLFSESARNVNEAAIILRANLDSLTNKKADVKKTESLEDRGDELIRTIIKELNDSFITPIEREDIYQIIKEMDNILDLINSSMHRFIMFNINESTDDAKLMGDMLVETSEELVKLMDVLRLKGCKAKYLNEHIKNIIDLEVKADKIFRKSVANLFETETDPLTVMKWKEIYQILEDTIDNCEEVAIILEGVVIKNA